MSEEGEPLDLDATVVVVGASLAGLRAAEALRRGGHRGRLVLVGEETHLPYDRPPLSKQVLAGTWEPEKARLIDADGSTTLGIDARLGHRAGVARRRRPAESPSTTARPLEADAVVVATGAVPRRLFADEGRAGAADAGRLARPCAPRVRGGRRAAAGWW